MAKLYPGRGLLTVLAVLATVSLSGAVRARHSAPSDNTVAKLISAAIDRTRHRVTYDGSYRGIAYTMGDVPATIGVCSDVVIRAYRAGLGRPDPNIKVLRRFDYFAGSVDAASIEVTMRKP